MPSDGSGGVLPQHSPTTTCTLVAVVALVTYLSSLDAEFVFDDSEAIVGNADVTDPDTPVADLFANDFWGTLMTSKSSHKSYRPLTVLTFRWNRWLAGGLDPVGFHLVNIVLHAIASVGVFVILRALVRRVGAASRGVAPLAALLFAVHPIHAESVAGIVGRADLLSALCYLLVLYVYDRGASSNGPPRVVALFLAVVLCALAMLFKEQGITAAGICFVYDLIVLCEVDEIRKFRTKTWLPGFLTRQLAMGLGVGFALAYRFQLMGGAGPPTFQPVDNPASFSNSTLTRFFTYNYVYSLNAWLLVNPWWLCFDWSMGCVPLVEQPARDPRILAPILFWLILGSLVWTALAHPDRSTRRLLALGFALLVIPFLPASNLFFRVGFVVAERNLYLPSIGFCLVLSVAATHVYRCATWKRTTKACVYALLALYAARAFARAAAWRTETSLFESGLRVCPRNAKVHYNVGKLLSESGRDNDLSVAHYREAVRLHPGYDQAWNNLGNLLKDSGDVVEAEACLHRALAANAEFAAAWMNLGIVKAALGKTDEAENCYRTAIKHRRKYPDAFYNLGNLYIELKRVDEAATAFRNATRLKATHVNAWLNLALLHENGGRLVEAESVLEEARRHLPDHVGFASNLANVLAKQGRFDESEPYYKMAISADPKSASLHGNLAVMYHRAGKLREAEREYALSLDLDPSNELMKDNLRKLVNQRAKENN